MKQMLHILHYILNNNPWYQWPQRLMLATFYQFYKRITKGILSKNLFNNKKIFLFPHSPISSAFVYAVIPDKKEILALRDLADENTILLDIGANIGTYSIMLCDKVKQIFAFEAHPISANYCKLNFLLNDLNPNQVITMAVSDRSGTQYFSNESNGSPTNSLQTGANNAIAVPSITLDEFMIQQNFPANANFIIKIDVEGFEQQVFAGASLFLTHMPIKAIIFENFSQQNQQVNELLRAFGYQLSAISEHNTLAVKHA